MMGAIELDEIEKHCKALLAALPLNAIRSETAYKRAVRQLELLLDAGGADENHPLALAVHQLGEAIEAYEARHHPMPDLPPHEMLRFLMQTHGIPQKGLPEIGSQGVVSEILSGKRKLNARQIAAVANRFNVPESVFF
jgi:HTH-type transcriptional regulator/antitoxin HigA